MKSIDTEGQQWIRNTDKEIKCFHPVCEEAMNKALANIGIDSEYEVQHHRRVGSIEMDFVIANRQSNKIFCVIEVKRTIAAVKSTRFQYQAMSYVQALSTAEMETPYYLLTNLECSCLFKFDKSRQNVFEQMIEPGIQMNHRFSEVPKDEFAGNLVKQYEAYLLTILNDTGRYMLTFQMFANEIHDKMNSQADWQKTIIALFYSYIRGAFAKIGRKGLKTIPQLSNKIDLVCQEALSINFKDIFTLTSLTGKEREIDTSRELLKQMFELGKTYVDADILADVMQKVLSQGQEHEGEVSTDPELATVLTELAKCVGGNLDSNECIMDPAAGCGNLLCAAIGSFSSLRPSQLIANDVNTKLLELLSLRLGLCFATTIQKGNTATITAHNIAEMDSNAFMATKFIIMNPPFLSATGRQCQQRKEALYRRIRQVKGAEATTMGGQMPLEGVFTELVTSLARPGTVIATILPNSHFTTKGDASKRIRKMLLEDMGLQLIFDYPQENLFRNVAQSTSIAIGIKGSQPKEIKYLCCNEVLSEIDVTHLPHVLSKPFPKEGITNLDDDFDGRTISYPELESTVETGWEIGNQNRQEARNFVKSHFANSPLLVPLSESSFKNYRRGKIGNSGCTDLLFLKRSDPFLPKAAQIANNHLAPGMNNAKFNHIEIGEGESLFVNVEDLDDKHLSELISLFLTENVQKGKKQRRDEKTKENYIKVLRRESANVTPPFSIALPRMLRAEGKVFVTTKPTFISTNFFVIQSDAKNAKILSSWMSTVFYQLECEAWGNNRNGLRKMEKKDFEPLHVPNIQTMSEKQKERILKTEFCSFINLRTPKPRQMDHAWAELLFGQNAEEHVETACRLLSILVANREK